MDFGLSRIAENYAIALFENTDKRDEGIFNFSCLGLVVELMKQEREMWGVFTSKMVDSNIRVTFIKSMFEGMTICKFFLLIEMNSRWHLLPLILYHYDNLQLKNRGTIAATLWTPHPISNSEEEKALEMVEELIGSDVRMSTKEDPSLISGFRLRLGQWLIENSMRNKIKRIKSLVELGQK